MSPFEMSAVMSDTSPFGASTPTGRESRTRQGRPAPNPAASIRPAHWRILLVDDDPVLLHLSECVLVAEGYQVMSCGNAEQAMVNYRREPGIDLLLTDVRMPPGISGLELADAITRQKPSLPVVVMSGAVLSDEQRKLIVDRNWSFIDKPVLVPRLLSVVSIMLRRPPTRSTSGPASLKRAV